MTPPPCKHRMRGRWRVGSAASPLVVAIVKEREIGYWRKEWEDVVLIIGRCRLRLVRLGRLISKESNRFEGLRHH